MYRIDRHPTMRDHPSTPMRESDLRRHLGAQTDRDIGLVDLRQLEGGEISLPDEEVVVFDATAPRHLHAIGADLWNRATAAEGPLFAVGSSGLEHHAFTTHWADVGLISDTEPLIEARPAVDRIAVMSGSASPVTARQIARAEEHGFATVRLDTVRLVDPDEASAARDEALSTARDALDDGRSVVLYTARGPEDPALDQTRERYAALDLDGDGDSDGAGRSDGDNGGDGDSGGDGGLSARLGRQQGRIFRELVASTDLERVCVAGGDTSGSVVSQLDASALEPVAPTAPGAPLCRVHSRTDAFDGIEIALKGGQTGGADYFRTVRSGGVDPERLSEI